MELKTLAQTECVERVERGLFVKHTALVLAANFAGLVVSFFLRPLVARFTGPSEYGVFALILSTAAVIPALTLLSINAGVLFFTAKKHGNKKFVENIFSTSIYFTAILSVIFFVPLYFFFTVLAPALGFSGFTAAYVLAFGLSLFSILQAGQQGLERFKAFSAVNVASVIVANVLAVATAFLLHSGLYAAFARAAGVLAISLVGIISLKLFGAFDKKILRQLFDYSLPLGLAGIISAFIAVVDRYIIAAFYNTAEVGFYDVSYSFAFAVLPLSSALLVTIAPKIIKNVSKLDAYYKRASVVNVVLLSGFALALFYYSDIIIFLLVGRAYVAGAVMPLKILALALPFMAIYGLNGSIFPSIDKPRVGAFLSVLLVFASIFFNFLLVPRLGSVGAAWANVLSYLVIVAIGLAYLIKNYRVSLGKTFVQIVLFLFFAVFYFLFAEKFGFTGKTAFYALFALLTITLQREAFAEVLHEIIVLFKLKLQRTR